MNIRIGRGCPFQDRCGCRLADQSPIYGRPIRSPTSFWLRRRAASATVASLFNRFLLPVEQAVMRRLLIVCLELPLLGPGIPRAAESKKPPMGPPNMGGPPRWAMPNMPKARAELPKDLVPTLIESLKDQDKSVRQYAASALARVGKEAVDPLLELLKSKDKAQRANAAYIL